MRRIALGAFAVETPQGWEDITDTAGYDDLPYTLAIPNGVGALQFSIALYSSGPVPEPTPEVLLEMVEEFGNKRGFGKPFDVVVDAGPPLVASGSFNWDDDYVRVWQVSDGRNFAFVTYTCAAGSARSEVDACEGIVRSMIFRP
jgi:hypothetical protein